MNWALSSAPASGSLVRYAGAAGGQFALATNTIALANGIAAPNLFYAGASPTPLAVTPPALLRQSDNPAQNPATPSAAKPVQVADQERLVLLTQETAPAQQDSFSKKQSQAGAAGKTLNQPTSTLNAAPPPPASQQPAGRPAQVATANSRQYQFGSRVGRQAPTAVQRRVTPALLNSFQFEQSGDHIRIVDGDNSVYEGQVITTAAANLAFGEPAPAPAEKRQLSVSDQRSKDMKQANESAGGALLAVSFRVLGTNITAKQLVTIEATLIPANQDTARKANQLPETLARTQGTPALGVAVKVESPSVRVRGWARLGTNEMPIDATGTATRR
jgi:hypothetical protein